MLRTSATSLALTLASVPVLAAPAHAETLRIDDPARDGSRGPDILWVSVQNRESAVVAHVGLADLVRGDVIVSVDLRRGTGVRMISELDADGAHTDHILPGSFSDREPDADGAPCDGFRVRTDRGNDLVTLRVPSRCLNDGDYGAIRFAVLTERGGGDADWAPETGSGDLVPSAWISRG